MTMSFVIEKNIPTPAKSDRSKYPFGAMNVGDSFLVPDGSKGVNRIASAAGNWGRRHGARFCTRKVDGGYRVWRLE